MTSSEDNLAVVEIKAFVPSKDFELSKQFYIDIGFELKSVGGGIAYFSADNASFLLSSLYKKEHADCFVMHLLVESADSWWKKIKASNVEEHYNSKIGEPGDRDWGMRDFTLTDPSGVEWRIGNNI